MKKGLLIGGGLAVIGGLAYLYFKNKKKQEAILKGGISATQKNTTTPNTSSQTGSTSGVSDGGIAPLPKAPTVQNQMELDAILDNIKNNMAKDKLIRKRIASWKPSSAFKSSGIGAKPSNPYPKIIEKLKNDLLKLGYEVKEGSSGLFLVKI